MKKITKLSPREYAQMFLVFMAYGWFGYFCLKTYIDYQKGMTGIDQFLTPVKELPLPTITVCSGKIFKNVSEETTADTILQSIPAHFFTREDLFHETFKWKFWDYREIFSVQLGLCISIRARTNATSTNLNHFWIFLQTGRKYQIFLHEYGSEYWFQHNLNPSKRNTLYIDTNTNDDIYGMRGKLKFKVEESLPRKNYICSLNATMESFTQCAFKKLVINGCTKSINEIGGSFNETNICRNVSELLEKETIEFHQLQKILHPEENNTMKCIKPCKTTSFDVSLEKMDQNGKKFLKYAPKDKGIFFLNFIYNDFIIEKKQEYFIMDKAGLISTVGGFLGLFLGSSCVSIIDWIGNHVKKYMR